MTATDSACVAVSRSDGAHSPLSDRRGRRRICGDLAPASGDTGDRHALGDDPSARAVPSAPLRAMSEFSWDAGHVRRRPPATSSSTFSSSARSSTTIIRSPMVATPRILRARARQRFGGWMNRSGGNGTNSRAGSTSRPTERPVCCTTISRVRHVERRARNRSAPAVDRRHDRTAREHDAVDKRRRIRDARDLLDHLDVRDVVAGQRVRRAGDREQNVVVSHHPPQALHRRGAGAGERARACRHAHHPESGRPCHRRGPWRP